MDYIKYYKRVFAKPCKFKDIKFRSKMERDFAKYLERNHIEWEYEKYKFELLEHEPYFDKTEGKKHTLRGVFYTPDFYLPQYNLIVEIKGTWFDKRLFNLKLRLFKHKYPDKSICVINSREEFANIKEIIANLQQYSQMGE